MAKEMRMVYQSVVMELMAKHRHVVMLDADLASASASGKAFAQFPDQTINCGISEANMMSVACGMSLLGMKPFVHTFAPFATRRVFDQLYVSGAFSQNSIFIYGSEPGIWAQYNGGTHTSFEDIALMRTLPNTVVCAPSDNAQFEFILRAYLDSPSLFYTRCARTVMPDIYNDQTKFELGKWHTHGECKDGVILAYGEMVHQALAAQEILRQKAGIFVQVVDAYCLYPYDQPLLKELAKTAKRILTVENHSQFGGLGELVARELCLNQFDGEFGQIAIKHHVSEVGGYDFLADKFGLNKEAIVNWWLK